MTYTQDSPGPDSYLPFDQLAMPEQYAGVPLGPFTASGQIWTGAGVLVGKTLRATTATIAVVQLYDGTSTGGRLVGDLDVSQGFAISVGPGYPGLIIRSGLYLNVAAGAPSIVVWYIPKHRI